MKSLNVLILLHYSLLIIPCCSVNEDANVTPSRYPEAVEQNIDPAGLIAAYDMLSGNTDTRLLIVERNGVIVQEEYLNGYTSENYFDVRSVTKSITSILIGIAIDKGFIHSVDETIADYLGTLLPNLDAAKGQITIKNLLTMTSGLPWHELGYTSGDFSSWITSSDQLMWILDKPLFNTPGEYWNYNTGACHILSAILTEATGMTAKDFAQQYLFDPLGIECGTWPTCSRGYNFAGHGINLRGPDMMKIGRLMLNSGVYNGTQIISSEWINESIQSYYDTNYAVPYGTGYGYMWWIGYDANTQTDFVMAMGYGGQFIIFVPNLNLVITAATAWSGNPNADVNWYFVISTIINNIFPAIQ